MSYLNDTMLIELCERHALVQPYDPARINPASVDLGLGTDFVNLSELPIEYWDMDDDDYTSWAKPEERFKARKVYLKPGVALLASTAERVAIPDRLTVLRPVTLQELPDQAYTMKRGVFIEACTGELRLKSSAARNGLDHALAGWIDPGFAGHLTLELHAHRPIELIAGKCYVQLVVATMLAAPARSYQQTGRYVGEAAIGAVLAKETK